MVNPIIDRLPRMGVSVSEVGDLDDHQLSTIGVVTVSGSARTAEGTIDAAERLVWSRPGLEVLDARRTWMEFD